MNSDLATSLMVSEIFYSLQGESSRAGSPCVFIRLSECNLRCSYCDTQYAWSGGTPMSVMAILQEIDKYPAWLVEITGGEPMLQDGVTDLMQALHEAGYDVMLETNGSIYLADVTDYVVKVVDVKCPGSGCADSFMKWNLKVLQPHDELKFVLTNYYDYRFALEFISANYLENRILLFSPVQSVLPAEILASWMLEDGVTARLQPQLHKLLNLR
ncbi:MAG: 7-carboxy-7-deazaguanine synthase QueE [Candidatus Syntrophosphaera sp.]|nr:7-carboxy-7-deazaguanine synthase QueE [Candidatus Syntrophosphaera sp.]